uniref:chitinase n=1 Tax=Hirsutella thompsonii TaxID=42368 RepID=A0A097F8N5_HIRTH|nr:chitinase [Hirsutella thompsonii]
MLRPLLAALPLLAHTAAGSVVHIQRRDTQGCNQVQSPNSFSLDITPDQGQVPFRIHIDGNIRFTFEPPSQANALSSSGPQMQLDQGGPGPEVKVTVDSPPLPESQQIHQLPQVQVVPDSQAPVLLQHVDSESQAQAQPESQPKAELQQNGSGPRFQNKTSGLDKHVVESQSTQSTAQYAAPSGFSSSVHLSQSSPAPQVKTQVRVKAPPGQPLAKSQVQHEPAKQNKPLVQSQVHHLPAKPQGNPAPASKGQTPQSKTFSQVHHAPAVPHNQTRFPVKSNAQIPNDRFIQGLGSSDEPQPSTPSPSSESKPKSDVKSSASPVSSVEAKPTESGTKSESPKPTKSAYAPDPAGNKTEPSPPQNTTQGRWNSLYFTNWGIYDAKYEPQQIPTNSVTHVIYAFANISSDGTVQSSDPWADVQRRSTNDTEEKGNNAYGCVKQLYLQKTQNRRLKTLLSVGGWSASKHGQFNKAAATDESRKRFAKSAVKLATDWGMDGLDVDWEYPSNPTEAKQMVLLLKECRDAFDKYAAANNQTYHFLLTAATPAGPENYKKMDLAGMDPYLDSWNIMAYDYAGTWEKTTGHQANLFLDEENPATTKASTNRAVADYMASGVNPKKISIGLPLYGRSFSQTTGFGAPFDGTGSTLLYRDLPRDNKSTIEYDDKVGAAWSYNPTSRELVTYDTVKSTQKKAEYILKNGLGGAFFWEASGDKTGKDSLVNTMSTSLGSLDDTPNMLNFPSSPYDNIRNGMK